ncbi:MAG: heat shock protein Hsp18 [Sporomusaceae bacterium]|nr:heat shock protein Hsp18 [Sporomusaceae bacterium]
MFDMVPFKKTAMPTKRGDYFSNFLDNFFDEDFFAPFNQFGTSFRVDLKETPEAYQIEADLPGIDKEAIQLEYKDHYLTIAANRAEKVEENHDGYVRRERKFGQFQRSFYIDNVVENEISAEFKNGVLFVILPKKEKVTAPSHQIPIK